MQTIYFLGDIGGHDDVLRQVIKNLGGDAETGYFPNDKILIQLGDLTRLNKRRGSGSKQCVLIADKMLKNSPKNWIQLFGNHEASLMGGVLAPGWFLRHELDQDEVEIVKNWWHTKQAKLAVAIKSPFGDILITHAGLTCLRWQLLGGPDAASASILINKKMDLPPENAFTPGSLVYHGHINPKADIVWAELVNEFYTPWCNFSKSGNFLPFHQLHGHAGIRRWEQDQWLNPILPQMCKINYSQSRRQSIATIGKLDNKKNARFIGLDWNLQEIGVTKIPSLFCLKTATIMN